MRKSLGAIAKGAVVCKSETAGRSSNRSNREKEVLFTHKRFEKAALQWLTNFHDWNISRQIVRGIQIPAYKCKSTENGLSRLISPRTASAVKMIMSRIQTPSIHGFHLRTVALRDLAVAQRKP